MPPSLSATLPYNGFISLLYEGQEDELTAIPRGARFLRSFVMR
jgi:hypothetical protein